MHLSSATTKKLAELRDILSSKTPEALVKGAEFALKELTKNRPSGREAVTSEMAALILMQYIQRGLLRHGLYEDAARLLWGDDVFTTKPESVKRIWRQLPLTSELQIMGAAAMGKSYSVAVWLVLDWLRDPNWTCIKVLSSTEEHAKRNVFAHIKNLHTHSVVPLPGEVQERSIQANEDDKQGIHLLTIPPGEEGKGRLRGFHPVPRGEKHPEFGTLSRVRAILDEAEEIPQGVWEDVDNILSTKEGIEHVKVISASNPKDRNSKFGQRCEPKDGWHSVTIEDGVEWEGRLGWHVIRLDGAKCENIAQRKTMFPGLLTWEGYQRYLKLGDTSPEYFTMARGWFPETGLHINIIPQDFIERAQGAFIFAGAATYVCAVDLAFEGGDKAVMTVARWGTVTGWTDRAAKFRAFPKPQHGLQVESQFELNKTHTLDMTDQIIRTCSNLHIGPEWVIVDRTGNGTGVHDALRIKLPARQVDGKDMAPVMGLNFGEAATETKILDDDETKACDLYDGVVTELFFATRKFMEFDYLKFSPSLRLELLASELTGRRYKQAKQKLVRVESKKEYKARGNTSPDHADSLTLAVHLVRLRSEFTASMLANVQRPALKAMQHGIVDTLEFIDPTDN